MSLEAPLKLRDEVGLPLRQRADQLKDQLSRLGGEVGNGRRDRRSSPRGRKAAIKYRDKAGNAWADEVRIRCGCERNRKAGAKLEDFAVQENGASRKTSPKKSKRRRKAKF
jgi:hypothetical protein